jgi:hypothetical protein
MLKQLAKRIAAGGLLAVAGFVGANAAHAAYLNQIHFDGNDCSGVFGQGFNNCAVNGSPIIAKFTPGEGAEINSGAFPSVSGSEWSFDSSGGLGTGSWTYNPGADDPAIRYWVAKAGNEFNLFYYTPNEGDGIGAALSVTSGSWITPLNQQGRPRDLSHISFYDTGRRDVPEPASLALTGLALFGAFFARQRMNRGS